MYNFLLKRGQLVAFLVGAIISIAHVALAMNGNYDFGLAMSYALIAISALAMVMGIAKYFIENPKQIKTLLGFLALFAIVGVLIMMASGDAPESLKDTITKANITPGVYKYINGSVNATVILLVLAFLGLIVSEVVSIFK